MLIQLQSRVSAQSWVAASQSRHMSITVPLHLIITIPFIISQIRVRAFAISPSTLNAQKLNYPIGTKHRRLRSFSCFYNSKNLMNKLQYTVLENLWNTHKKSVFSHTFCEYWLFPQYAQDGLRCWWSPWIWSCSRLVDSATLCPVHFCINNTCS